MIIEEFIQIKGFEQQSFEISSTGAQSPAMEAGIYDVHCAIDCYIKVDTTASNVTTDTGYLLMAGNVVPVKIPNGNKLGAITSAATGTIYFHRVA